MAASRHPPGYVSRGNTFVVDGTLTGADGAPLDMLQITIGEIVSTLWRGSITVEDSPFLPL